MNVILWTQNHNPSEKNTLYIDGSLSEYNATILQKKAMDFLYDLSCQKPRRIISGKSNKRFNHYFKFEENTEGFLVNACFLEKDEKDRLMPYMFFTRKKDMSLLRMDLDRIASQLNRSYDSSDFDNLIIEVRRKKRLHVSLIYSSIILIILILSLWIILQ